MQKGGRFPVLLLVWPHTSLPVSKGPVPSCRLLQGLIVGKAESKNHFRVILLIAKPFFDA